MDKLQDRTIEEIAKAHPESLKVFQKYRIDLCCGGRHSVAEVARKHGLELARLLDDLEKSISVAT